jgi:hypothetical protein
MFKKLQKIIGTKNSEYVTLDPTTPFYEFLSYSECCWSLGVKGQPSITRFIRYRSYLKEAGIL